MNQEWGLPIIFDSLLPAEYVWKDFDAMSNKVYREIQEGERTLILEEYSPGEAQVIRLISPRAEDYLLPIFTPGTRITARYTF
ncbi:MAG: hypothetical protein IMW85_08780 [Thermicanus sp.]|nr:hypothetical protein [Thermicanus sp.]